MGPRESSNFKLMNPGCHIFEAAGEVAYAQGSCGSSYVCGVVGSRDNAG